MPGTIGAVPHQGQIIGNGQRRHPELFHHPLLVVVGQHPVAHHARHQILSGLRITTCSAFPDQRRAAAVEFDKLGGGGSVSQIDLFAGWISVYSKEWR